MLKLEQQYLARDIGLAIGENSQTGAQHILLNLDGHIAPLTLEDAQDLRDALDLTIAKLFREQFRLGEQPRAQPDGASDDQANDNAIQDGLGDTSP